MREIHTFYFIFFIPILGLVAYPNWKRVLQLSFAFSVLALEVITLSKAFEMPVLGLGFGMLSFGIPYSLIKTQECESEGFSDEHGIMSILWLGAVGYTVIRGSSPSFVLKVATITLLDLLGLLSLHHPPGKVSISLTVMALWGLVGVIGDFATTIFGVVATLLCVAHVIYCVRDESRRKERHVNT